MKSFLDIKAKTVAPLDPDFCPAILAINNYKEAVSPSSNKKKLVIVVERENGCNYWYKTEIFSEEVNFADTLKYVERIIKFILWGCGGFRVYISGSKKNL